MRRTLPRYWEARTFGPPVIYPQSLRNSFISASLYLWLHFPRQIGPRLGLDGLVTLALRIPRHAYRFHYRNDISLLQELRSPCPYKLRSAVYIYKLLSTHPIIRKLLQYRPRSARGCSHYARGDSYPNRVRILRQVRLHAVRGTHLCSVLCCSHVESDFTLRWF